MGIREDVLALADDVESTIGGCYGCLLDKRGLCKAESDFDCNDEVCKFVAHRLRAIAEKDTENVTTVSAYDLLPEDERKAITWVREHGGLDEVEKRIMPEGMEWPRFEDGEPVRLGEHWEEDGFDESVTRIDSIEFADDGVRFENEYHEVFCRHGERVKRPEPKVLDADGVPIKKGDTVWHKATGAKYRVFRFSAIENCVWGKNDLGSFLLDCSMLTHAKPEPDSWERIEEDATRMPGEYCERYGIYGDSFPQAEAMACDLVRRCRALAERGEL